MKKTIIPRVRRFFFHYNDGILIPELVDPEIVSETLRHLRLCRNHSEGVSRTPSTREC